MCIYRYIYIYIYIYYMENLFHLRDVIVKDVAATTIATSLSLAEPSDP